MRWRVAPAVLVLVTMWAAACGSTVQQRAGNIGLSAGDTGLSADDTGHPDGDPVVAGDGLAGSSLPDPTGLTSSGSTPTTPRPDVATTTGGSGPAATTSERPTPSASPPPPQDQGGSQAPNQTYRGVTEDTIRLGVYGVTGFDSAAADLGFSVAIGNNRNQAQATVDYINENGGIAGRQVEMYYIDLDIAAATTNAESQQEAVCTEFTQDAQVYAVATGVGTYDLFNECLAKHDTPLFSGGDIKSRSFFEGLRSYLYMPGEMNFTKAMRHYGDGLANMGFFDDLGPNADPLATEPVIGVIYTDNANEREAVTQGLEPALAAHGLTISERFATTGSSEQYQSAVLQFRSAGVTHVLFGFATPLLFGKAAESQDYNPLYGLHSRSSPASALQGNMSNEQLRGSMGVGWQPYNDVDAHNDPGILNDKQQTCLDIMEEAGEDTSVRATGLIALWFCDTILLFAEAVDGAAGFSPAAIEQHVDTFGTSFESATTFGTYFGPDRPHDAATQARWFEFGDDCNCFRYISDPYVVD